MGNFAQGLPQQIHAPQRFAFVILKSEVVMLVLFVISVLCLCAVLWAAVSIARHVLNAKRPRRTGQLQPQPAEVPEVFFEDKMQQIREHAAAAARQAAAAPEHTSRQPWAPPAWAGESMQSGHATLGPATASSFLRKPPQHATAQLGNYRADWDYFNKDFGDLTDPYENNLRYDSNGGMRR